MVTIVESNHHHCAELAPIMREMDQKECGATNPGVSLEEVLTKCVDGSTRSYSVVDSEDGCLAIFGVRDVENNEGVPWLLASDLFFTKYRRRFIKEAPEFLKILLGTNDHLFNYVSVENKVSQRWLQSLGFKISTTISVHLNGLDFYPFDYYRDK